MQIGFADNYDNYGIGSIVFPIEMLPVKIKLVIRKGVLLRDKRTASLLFTPNTNIVFLKYLLRRASYFASYKFGT